MREVSQWSGVGGGVNNYVREMGGGIRIKLRRKGSRYGCWRGVEVRVLAVTLEW